MSELLEGTVTKAVGGVFCVQSPYAEFVCYSPKKLRYNNYDILVGDRVKFESVHGTKGVITEILPRKNNLCRPEVANIDICFIVVASQPEPDFYLVDKVLINCFRQKIEPVIVVNKIDLGFDTALKTRNNYSSLCNIVELSALDTNSVSALKKYVCGNTCCFAGQSAVGKTSILNALLPNVNGKTGGISQKSGRGMHTTRHCTLYKAWDGFIIDTCGFSLCSLSEIRSVELRLFWDDFVHISKDCKFASCTHTVEPDCAVKKAVADGTLCEARYKRYLYEFKELTEEEKKRY